MTECRDPPNPPEPNRPVSAAQLQAFIEALPPSAPERAEFCQGLAASLIAHGIETADLQALRTSEDILQLGFAGTCVELPRRVVLAELLGDARRGRALLGDLDGLPPSVEEIMDKTIETAARGDQEVVAAHALAAEMEARLLHTTLGQPSSSPAAIMYAQAAATTGDLHWEQFHRILGATSLPAIEVVTIPHEGQESISFLLRISEPSHAHAEPELNMAVAMYARAIEALPSRVPDELAPLCRMVAETGQAMASLALDRAIALLDENDIGTTREAVAKLARAGTAHCVAPKQQRLLAIVLGDALIRIYQHTGEAPALAMAIVLLRRGASCDDVFRTRAHRNLAEALALLVDDGGGDNALDEAINLLRTLVAEDDGAEHLSNLGLRLYTRYVRRRAPGDLSEGIDCLRQALATGLPEQRDHGPLTLALATALGDAGDLGSTEEALSLLVDLVAGARGDPKWSEYVRALARAAVTHQPEQAHRLATASIGDARQGAVERAALLDYATVLVESTKERPKLTLVVEELAEDCLGAAPKDEPNQTRALLLLALALCVEYVNHRDEQALALAAQRLELALRLETHTDEQLGVYWMNAATKLWAALETSRDQRHLPLLARAIRRARECHHLAGSDRWKSLVSYVNIAVTIAEETSDHAELLSVLPDVRRAIAEEADNPELQDALAMAIHQIWLRDRTAVDADEALTAARGALACANTRFQRARMLNNLGYLLLDIHRERPDQALLDEAISVCREAVALEIEKDPIGMGLAQLNLGGALLRRSTWHKDSAAVREGLGWLRAGARATRGTVHHPVALGTLGAGLLRAGDSAASLAEAADVLEQSIALLPPRHHLRDRYLLNLSQALQLLSRRGANPDALVRAISAGESALALVLDEHPLRATHLVALAELYWTRADVDGERSADGWHGDRQRQRADIKRAIELLLAAQRARPSGEALPRCLQMMGEILVVLAERSGDAHIRRRALASFRAVAQMEAAPTSTRARASWAWATTAEALRDSAEACAAFSLVITLIELEAETGISDADHEQMISEFPGAARHACAWAIENGELERAVELVEQGRGMLLGRRLAVRSRLEQLREVAPMLADAFASATTALATTVPRDEIDDPLTVELDTASRVQLAAERVRLLGEIRSQSGFQDFLQAPTIASLLPTPATAPVVIVNISRARCDALVVSSEGVQLVPLPRLLEADVASWAELFVGTIELLGREEASIDLDMAMAARSMVVQTLAWLWDTVAEPVLQALRIGSQRGDLPRIWWCPTGDLCFLPLHAAGRPPDAAGHTQHSLIDFVVSSYVPTLRSLVAPTEGNADLRPAEEKETGLLAAISRAPHATPGTTTLEIEREIRLFLDRFPTASVLVDKQAGATSVLAGLADANVVHFACHAHQRIDDPASGSLDLWDRPVTIRELRQAAAWPGRLALLLGCETARGGRRLADEAVTFATVFRMAGYAHAVGAMWPIDDEDAAEIATRVYAALPRHDPSTTRAACRVGDAETTARAVNAAVRVLRDRFPYAPNRWAGFVHVGE